MGIANEVRHLLSRCRGRRIARVVDGDLREPAEVPLGSVVHAVVVTDVALDAPVRHRVELDDRGNDVDHHRQLPRPRTPVGAVEQAHLARRGVRELVAPAHPVVDDRHEVGGDTRIEPQCEEPGAPHVGRDGRPHECRPAVAVNVDGYDRPVTTDADRDLARWREAVARLVEPHQHPAFVHVDQVRTARTVDIDQVEALAPEPFRRSGRGGHDDPLPPRAVAEIGPVRHEAGLDVDDVLQAVSGHVGDGDPPILERHVGELGQIVHPPDGHRCLVSRTGAVPEPEVVRSLGRIQVDDAVPIGVQQP